MNAETLASLTTAAGTLVLAVATFGATRSANSAGRTAERALLAGLRPVLIHAHLDDARQKVGFADQHWVHLDGPGAALECVDGVIYLAFAVRNVGTGIAVLQGWHTTAEHVIGVQSHADVAAFTSQTRDLYIAAGDLGFWQGAIRDSDSASYEGFEALIRERRPVTIDLLYTDVHGGQRTITRFGITPGSEDRWIAAVSRHWLLADTRRRRWFGRRAPN